MATPLETYLHAATRENTRRSYASAIRHFEEEWGGFLPATADSIARYLADHAATLAITTLKQRLAAIAQWHVEQGFPDPTKAPVVRKTLKGIRALHPTQERQAKPLQIDHLRQVVGWLDQEIALARGRDDRGEALRYTRDKALLLLGFWRGFRGDELARLHVEHIEVTSGQGMSCFLPQSKGDRQHHGRHYKVPALAVLCPVTAYQDWIGLAMLAEGPVFRGIDRWGHVRPEGLHINSLLKLMRTVFAQAGLEAPDAFSSHSLRRGLAGWANANGWDVKTLMEYVGWKDVKSAMRYIDGADPFAALSPSLVVAQEVMESPPAQLSQRLIEGEPVPTTQTLELELRMTLSPFHSRTRGLAQAHRLIEALCLKPHRMSPLGKDGTHYRLQVRYENDDSLTEVLMALLDDMHRIADNHQCFLEATLYDAAGNRRWS